jgi:branched-chain amino acid transport system permease protein
MKLRIDSPIPAWGAQARDAADRRLPPPLHGRAVHIFDAIVIVLILALPWIGVLDAGSMQVAVNVGLYVLLALGLNVVVGFTGLLDLGYIAFYAIGAYLYAFLASPQFGLHWPFLGILPLAAMVAGIFGVSFGAPTLRLRGDYLAIVTLGFGEIIQLVANNAMPLTNGPQGIYALDTPSLFGYRLSSNTGYYYLLVVLCALVVVVVTRLNRSRIGRAWAAIREDEDAARAAGINTVRMKLLAFAIGAMIGGLAGPVFAANDVFVSPVSFSLDQSILVLAMVVLGGMGSIRGVILGAAILVLVPETLRPLAANRFIIVGAIMVIMMIVRPGGLLPSRVRALEIKRGRQPGMALEAPHPSGTGLLREETRT